MIHITHQGTNSRGNNNYNAYTYNNMDWAPHFHKNMELIYALRGDIHINVNEKGVLLEQGRCAMILSNQIHSFSIGRDAMAWVLVFSEDFVPEFAAYVKDKQGSETVFSLDEEIDTLLLDHFIMRDASAFMKKSCLYAVCDQYLKQVRLEERKNGNDELICHVLDYIEAHYREDIGLERIAQEFGYEYHYLSRILNKKYNIRFKQILNEYRVEQAIRLLETKDSTMTEIAMQCGFQSIRSFNEVFRSITGQTPSDYIKNFLNVL